MSDSTTASRAPQLPGNKHHLRRPSAFLLILFPILPAIFLFHLDSLDPAELPLHELTDRPPVVAQRVNSHMLDGSERLGEPKLPGPEDIAYDPESGIIYTGCADGWVRRVRLNDSTVEEWVNTGGRPLGLVLGPHKEVIVTDTEKGLLRLSENGTVELLTDEAEGVKFKLADGVDVAEDGTIYFTDASYKYGLNEATRDLLEGRPHGRLMSYCQKTKQTNVLVRDLYFANGVAVSPNQDFVVFCETNMNRCKKYYISGMKSGTVDEFIDHLPGMPDNIRYDGEGHYWIALTKGNTNTFTWELVLKYPFIRKALWILQKYLSLPYQGNGGALMVDLEGNLIAHYYDSRCTLVTGCLKIGNHLYCGSLIHAYITRLDLTLHGAL
ncbi:hypothetical protein CDL15_Pgr004767 [Punica granatum]|uniref:Strictosidine synthase conserved region domain-containing protein n=1 Tax=Punica granatum TaxID=22663 RepID=A0A218W685_PUNGR|nr:hypothetical protein CDL15_Pgr004767 [Punica granatum]